MSKPRNEFAERRENPDPSVGEAVLFQPWFLPQHIAFTIRGLVPKHFWNKMRYFFDDYGCMICGDRVEIPLQRDVPDLLCANTKENDVERQTPVEV